MNFPAKPGFVSGTRRKGGGRGFTLVEVMVATVLLSMIILGILAVLIGAYRVAAKARYNDHARYVVKSFADQFLTQQTTDSSGNTLPMFLSTSATGYGLTWTNSDGSTVNGGTNQASAPAYITVLLGDNTGSPLQATVSRQVWYLMTTGTAAVLGTPTSVPQNGSAGYILRGDFTISYSFLGVQMPPLTITATRAVP